MSGNEELSFLASSLTFLATQSVAENFVDRETITNFHNANMLSFIGLNILDLNNSALSQLVSLPLTAPLTLQGRLIDTVSNLCK